MVHGVEAHAKNSTLLCACCSPERTVYLTEFKYGLLGGITTLRA